MNSFADLITKSSYEIKTILHSWLPSFNLSYYFQSGTTAAAVDSSQPQLNLGLILPHSIYNEREYNKAVAQTLTEIQAPYYSTLS